MIHRHFCIIVGNWRLQNWRLYRRREHRNHNGRVRWHLWDRLL